MNKFEIQIPVAKINAPKRLIFGYANVAVAHDGTTVVDRHNEDIDPEALEAAAYDYVVDSRVGDVEHSYKGVATLVESIFLTPEKVTAMGLTDPTFKGAGWFVGFKVLDDEVWKLVEDGKLACFSIGGTATAEELE